MTNKTISITINQIEKADKQFKQTHKVRVSGPFDDSQAPSWFTDFVKKQEKFNSFVIEQFKKQEQFNAKVLAKFDEYDKLFKQHDWLFKQHGWIKK